ncbi:hypothetical protein RRG08_057825 [Elysia crispata]|uniref:Uncharacterized protein n=1 Tax=Elysia crispata TaxID=231223 RepID=A0AAE1E6V2_9GAST|nr:hypothetical protein RRG08_057825 [Elysia crispata]
MPTRSWILLIRKQNEHTLSPRGCCPQYFYETGDRFSQEGLEANEMKYLPLHCFGVFQLAGLTGYEDCEGKSEWRVEGGRGGERVKTSSIEADTELRLVTLKAILTRFPMHGYPRHISRSSGVSHEPAPAAAREDTMSEHSPKGSGV